MSELDQAATVIRDLAQQATPQVIQHLGRSWMLRPANVIMAEITDPHGMVTQRPDHVAQHVRLDTEAALADYVNRFKTVDSMVFGDVSTLTIEAVLDYHSRSLMGANDPNDDVTPAEANHGQHRAALRLRFSQQWAAWTGIDGDRMSKLDFVRFLEEHREDVMSPEAAPLLELCRELQGQRNVVYKSVVRSDTDHVDLSYSITTQAGGAGEQTLPKELEVGIPVFYGCDPAILTAFLRYSITQEGELMLGLSFKGLELAKQSTFETILSRIGFVAQVPALAGAIANLPAAVPSTDYGRTLQGGAGGTTAPAVRF